MQQPLSRTALLLALVLVWLVGLLVRSHASSQAMHLHVV
jgi:hypothetical protein